jgi:hypothetical protein
VNDIWVCIITPECLHTVANENRDIFTLLQHKTSVHWTLFLTPISDRKMISLVNIISAGLRKPVCHWPITNQREHSERNQSLQQCYPHKVCLAQLWVKSCSFHSDYYLANTDWTPLHQLITVYITHIPSS